MLVDLAASLLVFKFLDFSNGTAPKLSPGKNALTFFSRACGLNLALASSMRCILVCSCSEGLSLKNLEQRPQPKLWEGADTTAPTVVLAAMCSLATVDPPACPPAEKESAETGAGFEGEIGGNPPSRK